jgi:signal transduction histidine kinase
MSSNSLRPASSPDSARAGSAIADLDALVSRADRPFVDAQVNLVSIAPGPAVLLWGQEAICLAYNRAYRTVSALRANIAGKPLFKAQPELERTWKPKFELAMLGFGNNIDGSAFVGSGEGLAGEAHLGWIVPVVGAESGPRGALVMLMDASAVLEPMSRLLNAVVHDLREPVIGVQVVSERLARVPKPTRERCAEDMERILEHTAKMDRLVDDLGVFARRAGAGGGARVSVRPADLGAIVKRACDKLNSGKDRPVSVKVGEVSGLWDEEAIVRIVTAFVASARLHGPEANVEVEVAPSRDGAVISIRDDGPPLRAEDAEQLFEPWRRGGAPGAERRRRGVSVGLFLARELITAHGGKVTGDRPPNGGFVVRVTLPVPGAQSAPPHSGVRR